MNKISRPLFYGIIALVVLAIIGVILASGTFGTDHGPTLMFFDEDLSDSGLGWMIAVPIMVLVGVIVACVLAGVAVVVAVVLSFVAVVVVISILLAFTPFLVFLSLPFLALYGLVKLFQRDQRQITQLSR